MSTRRAKRTLNGARQAVKLRTSSLRINLSIEIEVNIKLAISIATTMRKRRKSRKIILRRSLLNLYIYK
jgi:hypothetical protein